MTSVFCSGQVYIDPCPGDVCMNKKTQVRDVVQHKYGDMLTSRAFSPRNPVPTVPKCEVIILFYKTWPKKHLFPMIRVIKSRRLRWAGHVARMEEGRSAFKILTGKPTVRRSLVDRCGSFGSSNPQIYLFF